MKRILVVIACILTILFILGGLYVFILIKAPVNPETVSEKPGLIYHTGAIFVTNLKDSNSLLKTDLFIEVQDKKSIKILENNNHRIRDRIILILRNISISDFKNEGFEDILKNNIKDDLQNSANINNITDIYFNELVIQ